MFAGLGAGLLLSKGIAWLLQPRISFGDKVVVIAGGTRGLGLEMARLVAAEGANLALLARSEPRSVA